MTKNKKFLLFGSLLVIVVGIAVLVFTLNLRSTENNSSSNDEVKDNIQNKTNEDDSNTSESEMDGLKLSSEGNSSNSVNFYEVVVQKSADTTNVGLLNLVTNENQSLFQNDCSLTRSETMFVSEGNLFYIDCNQDNNDFFSFEVIKYDLKSQKEIERFTVSTDIKSNKQITIDEVVVSSTEQYYAFVITNDEEIVNGLSSGRFAVWDKKANTFSTVKIFKTLGLGSGGRGCNQMIFTSDSQNLIFCRTSAETLNIQNNLYSYKLDDSSLIKLVNAIKPAGDSFDNSPGVLFFENVYDLAPLKDGSILIYSASTNTQLTGYFKIDLTNNNNQIAKYTNEFAYQEESFDKRYIKVKELESQFSFDKPKNTFCVDLELILPMECSQYTIFPSDFIEAGLVGRVFATF